MHNTVFTLESKAAKADIYYARSECTTGLAVIVLNRLCDESIVR